ncbi:type II toxin-antitoxin system RelE family toxin [Rhodococcus ruber]|uniref:type II toxin-antitoxin system RelE family toxin n=1 Tax=Rhodococcus ruber TaxID=1830 RepID=UPI000EB65959|nr:type II toxin-antitoxin system RelE/ParE family toxin [Rhodococcus ruber]AXY49253.1 toxin RelE [Rhodococcus ruber]
MDEPHSIRVTTRAERDLQRLPEKIATACVEFIFGALAENPRRVGKPLRADLEGLYSARRGDYRVIYGVVDDARTVEVVHIDRRSDVYRR